MTTPAPNGQFDAIARARNCAGLLAIVLDRTLILDLDVVLARDPDLARALARDLDLDLAFDHARDLARDLGLALTRDLDLARDLARALALAVDRGLDLALDLSRFRALNRAPDFGRARDLDRARDLARQLTETLSSVQDDALRAASVGVAEGSAARGMVWRPADRRVVQVTGWVTRMLPRPDRSYYRELYRSELAELAQGPRPWWAQVAYAVQVSLRVLALRRILRAPAAVPQRTR